MAIPEITATGIDWADYQLGLAVKWTSNGCPQIGMYHELLAVQEMLRAAHDDKLSKDAIDGYLKFTEEEGALSGQ